ncbi:hypothetical protein EUTSA_v10012233mg [Eutrema salsugineum]|uniref:TF-B3 domain-containing protein n=1 Tax=Eutrema salsugineum TaxID=72664 RepID=V4MG52_EUTSA|nr:putative B3 domain-containing protein At2g27410 [Eutrema salsugineum]ESQ30311.1 hypothetical protein EUTSA_v10012233mg [Eutrema salsugineum]
MKKDDYYREFSSQSNKYWKLDILADVAAEEYSTMTSEEDKSKSSSSSSTGVKPDYNLRDGSNSKLEILVKVASDMLEHETPKKKRSQKSTACVDYKQEEEDRSFKKRKIIGRCKVGSSSTSTKEKQVLENLDWDPESLPSSCITECSKKKCPPTNISCKKLKIVRSLDFGPTQTMNPPGWLLNVMREYNGHDPKLIITKPLFQSDLDKGKNRLQMPINQLVNTNFLTDEETRIIHKKYLSSTRKTRKTTGLSVVLVDPLSKRHVVDFRKWKMNGIWVYVFNTRWWNVVTANKFKVGDIYHVWSFRSGQGKLCFALVPKNS